ncbi:hypothetical protein [Streptomyces thermoalcalitolerans]|uniref:Cysteinyl-tRNA synthetase n=1 Tax=Streptomyces thermoalcalitolerans TaxID=65605 RepID=A0ABP4A4F1_9ACTN
MLRITDARTGVLTDAVPVRRGPTRVEAHAPGLDATGLRVLLVTDLLVRALDLSGIPVWAVLTGDRDQADLRASATALGIRPFEDGHALGVALHGAQVVHVTAQDDTTAADGVRVAVAPVDAAVPVEPAADTDPAAWRLALLAHGRTEPVRLDAAALDEARRTLARWRRAVADWARRPSRPVPDEVRARLRDAWEDDLDVPAVVRVLEWVASHPDLADGARFETYAYADRLLGLDLTRDLGSTA